MAAPSTLVTRAPELAGERAGATALFGAFEQLRSLVVAWSRRLASDAPAASVSSRRRRAPLPGGSIATELEASAPSATSITSLDPVAAASTPSRCTANDDRDDGEEKGEAAARTPGSPPPWLQAELEVFFREHLAVAIQARESKLVNVMRECLQEELRDANRRAESQQREFDKWRDHLQSSLDRRVAEANALRKDFYKQLLMLRDLVTKQRNDPRTLRALEDVIATVVQGKAEQAAWSFAHQKKPGTEAADAAAPKESQVASASTRREKEKWEHRAKEAIAECQQLQEQVLQLQQQLEDTRNLGGELWFASAQHGLFERQRILDCVYRSKCSWEQVGDSIVELLNNEMVWEAVEDSASREKSRVSRGLEALIVRGASRNASDAGDFGSDGDGPLSDSAKRIAARRRGSAFLEGSRVIMCRTCNGCGYLDSSAVPTDNQEDDSYLRKTLAQVLELKTSLEEANSRTNQAEQQLLRTVMENAQVKETLEKIELARANCVDSGLQTDLDEEEDINVDEVVNILSERGDPNKVLANAKRHGHRVKQYEHLIVELKSLLLERDAGLAQLRGTLADAQTRIVTVQRTSQQEQERLQREIHALKGTLALAMSNRNAVIEEKQAAVNLVLKNMDRKKSRTLSTQHFVLPRVNSNAGGSVDGGSQSVDSNSGSIAISCPEDEEFEEDEVKRTELIARRYSEAIGRVQREYEEQQQRLRQTEEELGIESENRKRTNSIMLGSIAVSVSSHPRDLFKALTTTHQELLNFRRSSQKASALQTDRLLTLTTHLAHISEELAMVKKRTNAEIDFWKLDCEKLQNGNKALATDLAKAQEMIEEANERTAQAIAANAARACAVCEKHEARLLSISKEILERSGEFGKAGGSAESQPMRRTSTDGSVDLTEAERRGLNAILVDLDNLYSTFDSQKQNQVKSAITQALVGGQLYPCESGTRKIVADPTRMLSSSDQREDDTVTFASRSATVTRDDEMTNESNTDHSARLFRNPIALGPPGTLSESSKRLVLHGSAIHASRLLEDSTRPHNRKKIVRKILSEQEAYKRRSQTNRARAFTTAVGEESDDGLRRDPDQETFTLRPSDTGPATELADYSSYVDENGKTVFYMDIEEEDEELSDKVSDNLVDDQRGAPNENQSVTQSEAANVDTSHDVDHVGRPQLDVIFQIPSLQNPVGGTFDCLTPEQHQPLCSGDDISRDPEVIDKLRDLVNHNIALKRMLAHMNWRVLMSHLQAFREQTRLDYVNEKWRTSAVTGKAHTGLSETSTLPQTIRTAMKKFVQYRELVLDSALRQSNELRKQLRRSEAQVIHGVSTLLTSMTRKEKPRLSRSDRSRFVQARDSTLRTYYRNAGSPRRPVHPSARINLNEIPATQHVPTESFPLTDMNLPARHGMDDSIYDQALPATEGDLSPRCRDNSPGDLSSLPSIFENDNRFPQRPMKFVSTSDGEVLCLTHSTSTMQLSLSLPTKSPRKADLSLDTRRRITRSAGTARDVSNTDEPEASSSSILEAAPNVLPAQCSDSPLLRPIRPQSSPAGMGYRSRPLSITPKQSIEMGS